MTAREQYEPLPELFVVVPSVEDAGVLASLAVRDPEVRPVLVATGPDPMAVDEALDELGALAGRILLVEDSGSGPVAELGALLPRLDALVADDRPAALLVRGGSTTALAATQAAVWRGVPVVAVPADDGGPIASANQAAIGALVASQEARDTAPEDVRVAAAAHRLARERLATGDGPRVVRLPTHRTLSA